jgi:hypothetical protein
VKRGGEGGLVTYLCCCLIQAVNGLVRQVAAADIA